MCPSGWHNGALRLVCLLLFSRPGTTTGSRGTIGGCYPIFPSSSSWRSVCADWCDATRQFRSKVTGGGIRRWSVPKARCTQRCWRDLATAANLACSSRAHGCERPRCRIAAASRIVQDCPDTGQASIKMGDAGSQENYDIFCLRGRKLEGLPRCRRPRPCPCGTQGAWAFCRLPWRHCLVGEDPMTKIGSVLCRPMLRIDRDWICVMAGHDLGGGFCSVHALAAWWISPALSSPSACLLRSDHVLEVNVARFSQRPRLYLSGRHEKDVRDCNL